jgi:hypothetical protein
MHINNKTPQKNIKARTLRGRDVAELIAHIFILNIHCSHIGKYLKDSLFRSWLVEH